MKVTEPQRSYILHPISGPLLFWGLLISRSCLLLGSLAAFKVPTARTSTAQMWGSGVLSSGNGIDPDLKNLCADETLSWLFETVNPFVNTFASFMQVTFLGSSVCFVVVVLCWFLVESLKRCWRKCIIQLLPIGDRPFHRGLLTELGNLSADGIQQCPPGKWPSCSHLLIAQEGRWLPATCWGGLQGAGLRTESSTVVSSPRCGSLILKKHFFFP